MLQPAEPRQSSVASAKISAQSTEWIIGGSDTRWRFENCSLRSDERRWVRVPLEDETAGRPDCRRTTKSAESYHYSSAPNDGLFFCRTIICGCHAIGPHLRGRPPNRLCRLPSGFALFLDDILSGRGLQLRKEDRRRAPFSEVLTPEKVGRLQLAIVDELFNSASATGPCC